MLRNLVNVWRIPRLKNLPDRRNCSCSLLSFPSTPEWSISGLSRNYSGYYRSRTEESPDKYTAFEKSYDEWKYVEKLIPPTHVGPMPTTDPDAEFPSGWKAPNPPKDCPYLIRRTKNHLLPIYIKAWDRGMVRYTYIKKVEGNIWQLERDIGEYLQNLIPQSKKVIVTRTHEVCRHVIIKGDLKDQVMKWAEDRGF